MPCAFRLPDVGEGVHEAEIVRWLVRVGDQVAENQPLVEVQTDKVTVELPSPAAGMVSECNGQEGEVVKVGSVLVTIATAGEAAAMAGAPQTEQAKAGPGSAAAPAAATPASAGGGRRFAPATPSTRQLARELGLDINTLPGSGPGGRVTDDDVRRAAAAGAQPAAAGAPAAAMAPAVTAAPAGASSTAGKRVPLRGVRRAIAQHMAHAKTIVPHAAAVDEVDLAALQLLRAELATSQPGGKLSYLPFIIKAVAHALPDFPYLNASLDDQQGEIVLHGEVNIGIATATPEGLLVPVIRAANRKNVLQLAAAITDLAERARTHQLKPEEVRGSTFSISNIGAVGGLLSVPIINHPEVGILGVHRAKERPVVRDGQIVARPMMYLTLCFDHRVVDGDVATRFLMQVIQYLQQPGRLLAEMT